MISPSAVTFEQRLINFITPRRQNDETGPQPKRRKINMVSQLITDKEFAKAIKEKNVKRKKGERFEFSSTSSENSIEIPYEESGESFEECFSEENPYDNEANMPKDKEEVSKFVEIQKSVKVESYYAASYERNFYIGRVVQVDNEKVKMKFLFRIVQDSVAKYDWPA